MRRDAAANVHCQWPRFAAGERANRRRRHGALVSLSLHFSQRLDPKVFRPLLRPKKACQLGASKNLGVPPKPWGPSETLGSLQNLGISPRGRAGAASRAAPARAWPAPEVPGDATRQVGRGGRSCGRQAPRARSARRHARQNLHTYSLQAKTPSLACRVFLIKNPYSCKK